MVPVRVQQINKPNQVVFHAVKPEVIAKEYPTRSQQFPRVLQLEKGFAFQVRRVLVDDVGAS